MWGTIPFGCSLVTIVLAFVFRKKKDELEAGERLEDETLENEDFATTSPRAVREIAPKEPASPELTSPQHIVESGPPINT
jgi:hypothetical protein